MRKDIQQILDMNKAGRITDEQAAALLEELLTDDPPPGGGAAAEARPGNQPWGEWFQSTVSRVVDAAVDGAERVCGQAGTDSEDNSFHLSHVDSPSGSASIFRGNRFRMSKLKEFRLDRAEFSDNHVDASKLTELSIVDGKFSGSRIQASSLTELRVTGAEALGVELSSSKCAEVTLFERSAWRNVRILSSVAKEVRTVEDSAWENTRIFGAVLSDVTLRRSRWSEVEFETARFRDSVLIDTEWKNVVVRGLDVDRMACADCRFDAVVFTAGGRELGWRKRALAKSRFENCRLSQVLFSDCQLSRLTLRNVTASGVNLRGLDLSGQTLDGNDAFFRAVRLTPAAA